MEVSVLSLSMDRFDLLPYGKESLDKAGMEFEWLIADNGSKDKRVIEYIESMNPDVFIKNKVNKGIAPMWNELIRRSKGKYICIMEPDMEMQDNWLKTLYETYTSIPDSGVVGINFKPNPPETLHEGIKIHPSIEIFAVKMFSKKIAEEVGYFCEDYFPYGYEDSDFSHKVHIAGYKNYYVHGLHAEHRGDDGAEKSKYRSMKDRSLKDNEKKYDENLNKYYAEAEGYTRPR